MNIILILAAAFLHVNAAASAEANLFADGEVVVFFGDSITHGGFYHQFLADYYRTRFPERKIRFVNSGIGGDTAAGAMRRIPEDVSEYAPTRVVFHFGMNDVNRFVYGPESTAETLMAREVAQQGFRQNFDQLVAAVRAAAPQAKFTYLTPTPYEETAIITNAPKSGWAAYNNVGCNAGLSLLAGFVISRAARDGADLVDWHSALNDFRVRHQRENRYFSITGPDRVHPQEMGHVVMAWEFLKRQGAPAVVSEVEIDARSGAVVRTANAAVTDCSARADGAEFTLLAKALPMPVHPAAMEYVGEFDIEETLNRETVQVKGLAAGTYALIIDGTEVGRYSAKQFAEGVRLGFNEKTPQYRQAQSVAARHAELRVREAKLRDHHSARWFFGNAGERVDDIPAFRARYEEQLERGVPGEWRGYFGKFIPGYLDYWPRYREVRAALWRDQEEVRALAKPVAHRYQVVKAPVGERRISSTEYRERMEAAWLGQIAGVAWGAPTEFKFCGELVPEDFAELKGEWEPAMINEGFDQDDVYVEITFLQMLDRLGYAAPARRLGIEFANTSYRLWHANFFGRNNLRLGIAPPASGHPAHNGCHADIDYQIEADFSGIVSPGMPQGVIELGERFGGMMNYGDGIYAGQFVGALYAAAFFEREIVKIVEEALKCIPAQSRYAEMVRDALSAYREDPRDWQRAWRRFTDKYGHEPGCAHYKGSNINATLNGAMVLLGLLWGEGDIDRTIVIATRGGYDSDCNPSTAAGVLFTAMGKRAIPRKYYERLDRTREFECTGLSFDGLMALSERVARAGVVANGGRIERTAEGEEWFVLPARAIKLSPWVNGFDPSPCEEVRYTEEELSQIRYRGDADPKCPTWGTGGEKK